MSRLVVDLTPEEHLQLKMRALANKKTLKEYAKSYLFHIPNAETLSALESVEKKADLVSFESIDDLFASV